MAVNSIDAFRSGLNDGDRKTVDALREIIAGSHDGLAESIKWNAPSYSHNGEHKITLGITRAGQVQVVVHRGAKTKDVTNFSFDDPAKLARWPAKDRGVLIFDSVEDVLARREALQDIFCRWIDTTS